MIVSTLSEAEFVLPLLEEYKKKGRRVNVRMRRDYWKRMKMKKVDDFCLFF